MAAAGRENDPIEDRQGGVEEVDEAAGQLVRGSARGGLVEAGGDDVGTAAQGEVAGLAVRQAGGGAGAAQEGADVVGAVRAVAKRGRAGDVVDEGALADPV